KSCGWSARRWLRDSLLEQSPDYSEVTPVAFLERRVPPLGRLVRLSLRILHYTIAMGIGWPVAWFARRAADRYGVPVARSTHSSSSAGLAKVSSPSERP